MLSAVSTRRSFVDGEVAVVYLSSIGFEINLLEEALVVVGLGELRILLLKHQGVFALDLISVFIVLTIMLNAVYEEQAQNLDRLLVGGEGELLIEMLFDRASNHQALDLIRAHSPNRLTRAQYLVDTRPLDLD